MHNVNIFWSYSQPYSIISYALSLPGIDRCFAIGSPLVHLITYLLLKGILLIAIWVYYVYDMRS